MSIKLLSAIWDYDTTGNERTVLQVLCDYANDEGFCWPSMPLIAWKVGITNEGVRLIMRRLVGKGVVTLMEKGGGRGKSNTYQVNLDALPKKTPLQRDPKNPQVEESENPQYPQAETPNTPKFGGETPKQLFGGNRHIEPSDIEPSITEQPAVAAKPSNRTTAIIDAYCKHSGIEKLANYAKAGFAAKRLAEAGITPEDIPPLYDYVAEWAGGADLNLLLAKADQWRARRVPPPRKLSDLPPPLRKRLDSWLLEQAHDGLPAEPYPAGLQADIDAWLAAR